MVRQAFLKDLNDVFAKSQYFSEHDFDVTSAERNDGYTIAIKYRHSQEFLISAKIADIIQPDQKDFEIQGNATPGDIAVTEFFVVYGKAKFLAYVGQWLKRLRTELEAIPANRQLEEQRRQIDAILSQLSGLEDEYFSREEADSLRQRLDELEHQMSERIAETEKDSERANKRIEQLERDFELLKTSVEVLRKPGWASTFASRVAKWMKDPQNRGLLKDGVEVTRKLLE